jgi:hypothetical protein
MEERAMGELLRRIGVAFGLLAAEPLETYETTQPWVTYIYPYTDRFLMLTRRSAVPLRIFSQT